MERIQKEPNNPIPKHLRNLPRKVFKPKFLFEYYRDLDLFEGWTMVITISRAWCVPDFFKHFNKFKYPKKFPKSKCHLLIFNNTNCRHLDKALMDVCDKLRYEPFASIRQWKTFRRFGGLMPGMELDMAKSKLPTIQDMQRDICEMVQTEYFMQLEDDTLCPPNTITRLLPHLSRNKDIGVVSGVECARGLEIDGKSRLGVHLLKRPGTRILERLSLPNNLTGRHDVDAVGFYCFAARLEPWKRGDYSDQVNHDQEPNWAIDTVWTSNVKKAGWKVIADFDVVCLHMQQMPEGIFCWAIDKAVPMLDIWVPEYKIYGERLDLTRYNIDRDLPFPKS